MKYKWFHRSRFIEECRRVATDGDNQPETICERLFLEALSRTNDFLMHNTYAFLRGRENEFAFRGPQHYVHTDDLLRMHFSPSPSLAPRLPFGFPAVQQDVRFPHLPVPDFHQPGIYPLPDGQSVSRFLHSYI